MPRRCTASLWWLWEAAPRRGGWVGGQGAAILRGMVERCMAPGCVLVIGPSEGLPKARNHGALSLVEPDGLCLR